LPVYDYEDEAYVNLNTRNNLAEYISLAEKSKKVIKKRKLVRIAGDGALFSKKLLNRYVRNI